MLSSHFPVTFDLMTLLCLPFFPVPPHTLSTHVSITLCRKNINLEFLSIVMFNVLDRWKLKRPSMLFYHPLYLFTPNFWHPIGRQQVSVTWYALLLNLEDVYIRFQYILHLLWGVYLLTSPCTTTCANPSLHPGFSTGSREHFQEINTS